MVREAAPGLLLEALSRSLVVESPALSMAGLFLGVLHERAKAGHKGVRMGMAGGEEDCVGEGKKRMMLTSCPGSAGCGSSLRSS